MSWTSAGELCYFFYILELFRPCGGLHSTFLSAGGTGRSDRYLDRLGCYDQRQRFIRASPKLGLVVAKWRHGSPSMGLPQLDLAFSVSVCRCVSHYVLCVGHLLIPILHYSAHNPSQTLLPDGYTILVGIRLSPFSCVVIIFNISTSCREQRSVHDQYCA